MRQIENTTPYGCSKCAQKYQLVARTDKEEGRLPWLVVPEDASPKDADEAIAMCVCQRCLSDETPSTRGLMAVLESFDDIEIIEGEIEDSGMELVSFPRRERPRAPGFDHVDLDALKARSSRPAQDTSSSGFDLSGLASSSSGHQSSGGGFDLSGLASRGSSMPQMPESEPVSAPTPAAQDTEPSMLDQMATTTSQHSREERHDKARRPSPRRSRRAQKPLKAPVMAGAMAEAMQKLKAQKRATFHAELAKVTEKVNALKRTRRPRLIAMLEDLIESAQYACAKDPDERSVATIVQMAGADEKWLSKRFPRYVVAETAENYKKSGSWNFSHLMPVLTLIGLTLDTLKVAVFTKMMEELRMQIDQIRVDAPTERVEDRLQDFRRSVNLAAKLDPEERKFNQILSALGTSKLELDKLETACYLSCTVAPKKAGKLGGGGGTKLEARTPRSLRDGTFAIKIEMDIDGNPVEVIKIGVSVLPEANEPLRRVPAGKGAQAEHVRKRIEYPEGESYGPCPTIVFPDNSGAWSARVRTDEGGEETHQVMGAGQKAHMLRVDTESSLGTVWVYRPVLDDGDALDAEMVWCGSEYEDWRSVKAYIHMGSLILILESIEQRDYVIQDLVKALRSELGQSGAITDMFTSSTSAVRDLLDQTQEDGVTLVSMGIGDEPTTNAYAE